MRFVRSRFMLAALLIGVIAAQSVLQSPTPVDAQAGAPTFVQGRCPFSLPANMGQVEGKTFNCGTVTVPEDHSNPGGKTVALAVAVFKAQTANPPNDAVIYLDGGPGGFTLLYADFYVHSFQQLLANHDVILFDQRGTGFTMPSLYCPEVTDLLYQQLQQNITPDVENQQQTDTTLKCRQRLVGQGIDLSKYTSAQDAADVDSIRQALGYQTLDLYGISYGTRLALTVMRDFPKSVRSSVIDSNVPLEADLIADYVPNTERVFKQLWTTCAADTRCNQTYPNLESVFYALVDKLDAQQVTVQAQSQDDGKTYNVVINGYQMIYFLFNSFYLNPNDIAMLPAMIYGAHDGHFNMIADLLVSFADENKTLSIAMYFSIDCPEGAAFSSLDKAKQVAQGNPPQIVAFELPSTSSEFDICKAWGTGSAPAIEHMPVKSDIPTLVMAGSYDPVTPPRYSKQVADELSKSTYVEIPNSGHGASLSGRCAFSVVVGFIADPASQPNTSCVSGITPSFAINPRVD